MGWLPFRNLVLNSLLLLCRQSSDQLKILMIQCMRIKFKQSAKKVLGSLSHSDKEAMLSHANHNNVLYENVQLSGKQPNPIKQGSNERSSMKFSVWVV